MTWTKGADALNDQIVNRLRMVSFRGKAYVHGGLSVSSTPQRSLYEVNPVTGEVTYMGDFQVGMYQHGLLMVRKEFLL